MKIKSVAALCKKRKNITLFQGSTQWVGDGSSMYPLFNMPEMEMKSIMAMFDIPESKVTDFTTKVREIPTEVDLNDFCATESEIDEIGTCVSYRGNMYEVIPTSAGAKLISMKYLSPFSDMIDCELYERKNDAGNIFIAVKQGMILYGIIIPEDITEFLQKDIDKMSLICNTAIKLKKQKESAYRRDEYVQKKFTDPEVDYDEK